MCNGCWFVCKEVPLSELAQQLEYARIICADINEVYSEETPQVTKLINEYHTVHTKLSMLTDFLFQAKLWYDTVTEDANKGCCSPEKNHDRRKNENIKD